MRLDPVRQLLENVPTRRPSVHGQAVFLRVEGLGFSRDLGFSGFRV